VPSIKGVEVDAVAPSGTSAAVINPESFVKSLVLVGMVIFAILFTGATVVPFV